MSLTNDMIDVTNISCTSSLNNFPIDTTYVKLKNNGKLSMIKPVATGDQLGYVKLPLTTSKLKSSANGSIYHDDLDIYNVNQNLKAKDVPGTGFTSWTTDEFQVKFAVQIKETEYSYNYYAQIVLRQWGNRIDIRKLVGTNPQYYEMHEGILICNGSYQGTWLLSDSRYKYNKMPIENALETINKLTILQYDKTSTFKEADYMGDISDSRREIGLIAQDVERLNDPLLSQCVELPKSTEDPYKINYSNIFFIKIKAIQELYLSVKAHKNKRLELYDSLQNQRNIINTLISKIDLLEKR